MGAIGRAVRVSGLDDRFTFFMSGTLALSILVCAGPGAVMSLLMGEAKSAMSTLVAVPLGGLMLFWVMLFPGLLVSIPTFAIVWRTTGSEAARPLSAEYAGVATAGAASFFWVALLHALTAWDVELVMGVGGMVAVLVAPRVARWAYKDGIDAPEPGLRAAAQRGPHDAC